jgi:hypothetical protein
MINRVPVEHFIAGLHPEVCLGGRKKTVFQFIIELLSYLKNGRNHGGKLLAKRLARKYRYHYGD